MDTSSILARPALRILAGPIALAAILCLSGGGLECARAADGTWTSTTGGLWSDPANWSVSAPADGSGSAAFFNALDFGSDLTINLDSARTISRLVFGDSNPQTAVGFLLDDNGNAGNVLTLGTAPSITVGRLAAGRNVTISTILGGTTGLTKNGPGALILTRGNAYTGTTTLSGGALTLNFAAAGAPTANVLPSGSPLTVAGSTALTLTGAATTANTQAMASTAFNSGLADITVNAGAGGTMSLGLGAITGLTGSLVRFSGTGTIAGTMANTSTGGVLGAGGPSSTAVNAGFATFGLSDYAAVNAGTIVAGSTVAGFYVNTVPNGSGSIGNWDVTANASIATGQRAATVTRFNAASALTVTLASGALFTNTGILVTPNVGANNTTISGAGSYQVLRVTSPTGNQQASIWQNNALGFLNFTAPIINGRDAGDNNFVVKGGAGTLVFGGANAYAGRLIINEGAVSVGSDSNLGAANVGVTLDGGMLFGNATFTAASGRTVTLPTAGNLSAATGATMTIGGIVSGAGELTIGSGTLVGTGAGTANPTAIIGNGTVELLGTNTFTGAVNLNAGVLRTAALSGLGTGTAVTFNGGGLQQTGSYDISSRTVTIQSGGATIDTAGNAVTYANAIGNGGTGNLTKSGLGTLTLSGANTYTGSTTVAAGSLFINGSVPGAASVNTGATMGGSGTVGGGITVNTGARLAPGAGLGTLTTATLSLASGSFLDFEFNTTPANDYINVTAGGGLTLDGGGFNLYLEGGVSPFSTVGTYNLIGYSGAIGGTGVVALSVLNPQPGKNYAFNSTGTNVTLQITPSGVVAGWAVDANGAWGTASNWAPATVPDTSGATANLDFALTAPATVTLDANRTVGALSFTSAQSYTVAPGTGGTLALDNSTSQANLIATSGSHTITAPVVLNSQVVASIQNASGLTLSGVVSGANSVTKSGTGTLDLTSTANTFSGDLVITAGTVGIAAAGSLGAGGLNFDGGTLRFNAGNVDDISTGRVITLSVNGGTLNTNGNEVTLASAIGNNGAGGLTKSGAGLLTLGAANTYNGPTMVTAGTLSVASNAALGIPATGAGVTLNGGTLRTTATFALNNAGANSRPLTIGAGSATISPDAATTLTVSGAITGTSGLTKTGAGRLTLSGSNTATLSSPITLNEGTIELAGGQANGMTALGTGAVTFNGDTTLRLNGAGATDNGTTYGTLANALIVPAGQTGTIILPKRMNFNAPLTGAGTLNIQLDGTRDDFNANWSAFTGQINLTGAGEMRLVGGNAYFNNAKLNLGAGVLLQQLFNPPSGSGTETVQNIGELSGATGSSLGGNPVGGRFVNWTIGALNTSSTFAGAIVNDTDSGNGIGEPKITKVGSGILTLTGASTFTGPTVINSGTIAITNNTALGGSGAASAGTTVSGGNTTAALALSNNITVAEPLVLGGKQGANIAAAHLINTADTNTLTGPIDLTTGGTDYNIESAAGTLTISSNLAPTTAGLGPRALNLQGAGEGVWSGNLSDGTAVISVTKRGTGTWTLSGAANSYTGGTTVHGGGILRSGATNALPVTTTLTLGEAANNTSGTFDLAGSEQTIVGLVSAGSGASLITNSAASGSGKLTVTGAGSFAGSINDGATASLAVTKSGSGTQILSGSSSYTGPTVVNGGTLEVSGSLSATASVDVTNGSLLLAGTGTDRISNTATVTLSGGTLGFTAIVSGGSELMGQLILTANSILDLGAGSGNQLLFSGLSLGANTLSIYNWSGNTYAPGQGDDGSDLAQDRLLFGSTTLPGNLLAQIRFYADGGATYLGDGEQISFGSNFEIVPVPEPGVTGLLGASALLGLVGVRERRRAQAKSP